jgi:hypothetical protein
MDASMSSAPPSDPFLREAAQKGYTPESLPALRQYLFALQQGNLESAERLKDNLRTHFERLEGS